MTRVIALTGATGFIGSSFVRKLAGQGWQIRALIRRSSRTSHLAGLGVEFVEGALDDPHVLERLVHGAQAAVYCAGSVRGLRRTDFEPVNVAGVAHLSQVARAMSEPPRLLLISSLAASQPLLSPYAWSKREGERVLAKNAGAIPWTVFRPPAVYGPGDRELLPLLHWMRRGIVPVLGEAATRVSLIFVDDLAEAVARWAAAPMIQGRILEIHDGKPGGYSWAEIIGAAEHLRGRGIVRLPVSRPVAHAVAWSGASIARLVNRAPMLTPAKVRELFYQTWVCDNREICSMIDWSPRVALQEGLSNTLQWRR